MWLVILLLLSTSSEKCQSTIFGYPGDKLAGGDALLLKRKINDTDVGIASRTLPLGSIVLLERDGFWVAGRVLDRGPFGRRDAKGKWYNGSAEFTARRYRPGSTWRGCADLTPAAARALKHDGWERITIHTWPQEDVRVMRRRERRERRENRI